MHGFASMFKHKTHRKELFYGINCMLEHIVCCPNMQLIRREKYFFNPTSSVFLLSALYYVKLVQTSIKWMMFGDEYLLCARSLFATPLAGEDEKLAKGARDDAQVGSRGASSLARQVLNADFPIAVAGIFQLVE